MKVDSRRTGKVKRVAVFRVGTIFLRYVYYRRRVFFFLIFAKVELILIILADLLYVPSDCRSLRNGAMFLSDNFNNRMRIAVINISYSSEGYQSTVSRSASTRKLK